MGFLFHGLLLSELVEKKRRYNLMIDCPKCGGKTGLQIGMFGLAEHCKKCNVDWYLSKDVENDV